MLINKYEKVMKQLNCSQCHKPYLERVSPVRKRCIECHLQNANERAKQWYKDHRKQNKNHIARISKKK